MDNSAVCDVGIVGAGIIGLTTALTLAQAGYRVAIIARNLPGDNTTEWASPWAGAGIMPVPSDDPRDVRMQRISLRKYGALAQHSSVTGVQTVEVTEYLDDKNDPGKPWYSDILEVTAPPSSELPPGTLGGRRFVSTTINPDLLLPWLQKKLQGEYRVLFIKDTVSSLAYAAQRLRCHAVVNASGVGALHLAGDKDVTSVRGQTVMIKSSAFQPGMDRKVITRRGNEYTYLIPRVSTGGIIVGGINDEYNSSTEVDEKVRLDIINRANIVTGGQLQNLDLKTDIIRDIVAFRPGRKGGYRIEREGNVIHAYGFAGAGYRYSWGAAAEVAKLVDELHLHIRANL